MSRWSFWEVWRGFLFVWFGFVLGLLAARQLNPVVGILSMVATAVAVVVATTMLDRQS